MAKPLEDLLVLDLTRFLSGPYCTLILGGLGAEVIKIEEPGIGDPTRDTYPFAGKAGVTIERSSDEDLSLGILHRARNKKSITLNLKSEKGKELFRELVRRADVLVENFAAGVMERLGLAYEVLREINPRMIYCSISGFGHTGPNRDFTAFDPVIQAMSGATAMTGFPEGPPVRPGIAAGDTTAPFHALVGILTALHWRERTGQGQAVDISMQDCLFFTLPDSVELYAAGDLPRRAGNTHLNPGGRRTAPFNLYRTRDGEFVICGSTEKQWNGVLQAIGREDLIGDPRYAQKSQRGTRADEVDLLIQGWAEQRSLQEALEVLREQRVPCGPVLGIDQLMGDPQIRAREMAVALEHPTLGQLDGLQGLGLPVKLSQTPGKFDRPAPLLGQHNQEVYRDLLGLSAEELERLKQEGVV
ncbi:MAG: CoA transferase [Candidatus Tectomicrobia bacterium]|uniref:CoA transferase n=1 Tax=Tectimicrobiota bacterium TaxID=2528274 RepID=A0A932CQH1_UNCTE|nr:CoA transferase [Candidatus Tectomicrobia bacterium]